MAKRNNLQLSYGPVVFPCRVVTAHESTADKTHPTHAKCGGLLNNGPKWCATCSEEAKEFGRGYKVNSKTIVALTEADLAGLPVKSQDEIDVVQFFPDTIDSRYHGEHLYYIAPEGKAKGYTLLLGIMAGKGLKALARFRKALWSIEPFDGVLMMREVVYASDLRSPGEVKAGIKTTPITDKEIQAVSALIATMVQPLNLEAYTNAYTEALEKLVEDKLAGRVTTNTPTVEAKATSEDGLADEIMAFLGKQGAVKVISQPAGELTELVPGATPEPVVEAESEMVVLPW
jgi:DNA end-binding protein Ku